MIKLTRLLVLVAVTAAAGLAGQLQAVQATTSSAAAEPSAHAFSFTSIAGEPLPLARYAGQPVLLVNTASRCGFTYQYEGLQALYERYRARGLVVLGVPSNDFGGQEPGDESQIKQFCEATFGITFPMTEKQQVRGETAHPLYRWLADRMGSDGVPRWNFHKILLDGQGKPVAGWPSSREPLSEPVTAAVEAALAEAR